MSFIGWWKRGINKTFVAPYKEAIKEFKEKIKQEEEKRREAKEQRKKAKEQLKMQQEEKKQFEQGMKCKANGMKQSKGGLKDFLTGLFFIVCIIVIGIMVWPSKKPTDIYDVKRLPAYDEIKVLARDDRELNTWIEELFGIFGTEIWWRHKYHPDHIKPVSRTKSEEELSYDAAYLNGLIQNLNDRSSGSGWKWEWESKRWEPKKWELKGFGGGNPSYTIRGSISEKDWLSIPLKERHEFMVSIYENAAMKTRSYVTVDIVDEKRNVLGRVTGARVDILIGRKEKPPKKDKDEEPREIKEAKSLFNKFLVEETKVEGRSIVARAFVSSGGSVDIKLKEPSYFVTISDDQFKEVARFISSAYAKIFLGPDGYIRKEMEKKKEDRREVTFYYNCDISDISDESFRKFPAPLAASRYTYLNDPKMGIIPTNEKLKPPFKCLQEWKESNLARENIKMGKERFKDLVLKKYKLYGEPIFKDVVFAMEMSNYVVFKIYNSRLFGELPNSKLRELFESLGRDHYEIFGPSVRRLLSIETFPFEGEKERSSPAHRWPVIFEMHVLMKWDKATKDLWVSMGHRGERGAVWESVLCKGSYTITVDGRTPMECEYWNGKRSEF